MLADGHSFAIFDAGGDIVDSPLEALGLFHRDTRYLSRFELRVAGETPYFLNSFLSDDKAQLRINLTNPDLGVNGEVIELPRNSIQLERSWALGQASLFHRLVVRNYTQAPVNLDLELRFAVDFVDLFEVRGVKRQRHGEALKPELHNENRVRFLYRGLDDLMRYSEVDFLNSPTRLESNRAVYELALRPDSHVILELRVSCGHQDVNVIAIPEGDPSPPSSSSINFDRAVHARRTQIAHTANGWAKVTATNELMNSLLRHSDCDLMSIISRDAGGTYIMAGIPWFATLFGRDSILTALSVLPFSPSVAAGTLRTLAHFQGTEVNQERDEQPGKIVHEMRAGEMAVLREIPFGRYYGSVDSTPLFLWLFGRYVMTTGDLQLAEELWPNVERALEWIKKYGDADGDGYVEYMRETPTGLANQGWKDSFDSISHADGTLARPPIALCEVQGYVYAGYLRSRRSRGADQSQRRRVRALRSRANAQGEFYARLLARRRSDGRARARRRQKTLPR